MNSKEIPQGSPEWHKARLGCLTASRANDVAAAESTAAYQNYFWKLVAERETGLTEDEFVSEAMERGTEMEPVARAAYETHTGQFVTQTGFWLHPEIEWFGASPDGLVGDDGLIEIKCPKTSTHMRYRSEGKVPTKYKRQMICQLLCTGRKWVDFVSFDNRVRESKQLFIVRYVPTEKEIKEMLDDVNKFLQKVQEECK